MSILDPLKWLEGRWKGEGSGGFPTMEDFRFVDEMWFKLDLESFQTEPLIHFEEIARVIEEEMEVFKHWETGYFKPDKNDTVQFYVCHNTGRIEVMYGYFKSLDRKNQSFELILNSNHIRNDEGTVVTLSSQRILSLKDDKLGYQLSMATEGVEEMTHHLQVNLRRDN